MKVTSAYNHNITISVTIALLATLTACTTENWYKGAQSAQTTHCMKEPLSEFEDCNRQTEVPYQDYREQREQLIEENTPE
jgi:hypothetical protein